MSMLEWFLKDHVTLNTGVIMMKIHNILKYIQIEKLFQIVIIFHNITVFTVFF